MQNETFEAELNRYSQADLRLIYDTQKELYSEDELAMIAERLEPQPEKKKDTKTKKLEEQTTKTPKSPSKGKATPKTAKRESASEKPAVSKKEEKKATKVKQEPKKLEKKKEDKKKDAESVKNGKNSGTSAKEKKTEEKRGNQKQQTRLSQLCLPIPDSAEPEQPGQGQHGLQQQRGQQSGQLRELSGIGAYRKRREGALQKEKDRNAASVSKDQGPGQETGKQRAAQPNQKQRTGRGLGVRSRDRSGSQGGPKRPCQGTQNQGAEHQTLVGKLIWLSRKKPLELCHGIPLKQDIVFGARGSHNKEQRALFSPITITLMLCYYTRKPANIQAFLSKHSFFVNY